MRNSIKKLADFFVGNDNFLILTHEKPDGDALGSLSGLYNILRENGKRVDAFLPEPPPVRYENFIPEGIIIGNFPALDSYSNIICLDTSTSERIGVAGELKEKILSSNLSNIDHHPDNKFFGRKNFIDSKTAAVSAILYKFLRKNMRISQFSATCLLVGIVMDTGGFRFDNTDSKILKISAELIELGANYRKIVSEMFFSKPLNYVKLEAVLVSEQLKTACSGRYAWAYLSDEMLAEFNVDKRDTETITEPVRQVKDVEMAAVFYRKDDGFKFSLRSKNPKYSAAKIARAINGGGHEMAAGGFIKTDDITEAEDILLAHVKKMFKGSKRRL